MDRDKQSLAYSGLIKLKGDCQIEEGDNPTIYGKEEGINGKL